MSLLLCIRIGPKIPVSYFNPIEAFAKDRLPDVISFDCDNHSENAVVRYALDLLKESTKSMIVVRVEEDSPTEVLGNVRILFEHLLKSADSIQASFNGIHPVAERMLSALPESRLWKALPEETLLKNMELFFRNPEK